MKMISLDVGHTSTAQLTQKAIQRSQDDMTSYQGITQKMIEVFQLAEGGAHVS